MDEKEKVCIIPLSAIDDFPDHLKKTQMPTGAKRFMKVWTCIVLALLMISLCAVSVFAAEDDPVEVVNNLSDFMFGIVRALV